jgi:hypothetical protein
MIGRWKHRIMIAFITAAALCAICQLGLAQSPPATIIEIQGNNCVSYYGDVFDYSSSCSLDRGHVREYHGPVNLAD